MNHLTISRTQLLRHVFSGVTSALLFVAGCTSDAPADTAAETEGAETGGEETATDDGNSTTGEDLGCPPELLDCDGTCVDARFDPANCGACGVSCAEGEVCSDGMCALGCGTGTTECGGVCVDTSVDAENCGACGTMCASDEFCVDGTCAFKCSGGTVFCGDGCVDIEKDAEHCGGCNVACGAGEVCDAGVCGLQCPVGTTECSGSCVATSVDPENCGACGTVCGAGEVCSSGTCASSCGAGTVTCNDTCVDTDVDPANCGACDTVCGAGEYCAAGACTSSCGGTTVACNGGCVDTSVDPANCGACGDACAAGLVCESGVCGLQCSAGAVDCGGSCVDLQYDPTNCGACGTICAAGEFCTAGVCDTDCGAGTLECSGQCVDTQTDEANCGACAAACGVGELCAGGSCQVSCGPGTLNCGGTCVDGDVDPSNCGGCGVVCSAGEVCAGGSCAPSCPPGEEPCAGGCVDISSDSANCGGCGVACLGGEVCTMFTCQPACGNGQVDPGEVCDSLAMPAECTDFGFSMPGPVLCRPDCLGYDWNQTICPTLCGDGTVEPGEDCDLGGGGSSADCDADCSFPLCRDGVLNVDAGEVYDQADLGLRGFGTLVPASTMIRGFGADLATGHFDAGPTLDLVVGARSSNVGAINQSEGTLHVYLSDGVKLAPSSQGPLPGEYNTSGFGDQLGYSVAVGDVNLDGFDDIVGGATRMGANEEGGAKVFLSNGDGTFNPTPTVINSGVPGCYAGYKTIVADVNGDDNPDVLLGAPFYQVGPDYDGAVFVALGDGAGAFAPATPVIGPATNGAFGSAIAVGDLNGDMIPDLISGADSATNLAMEAFAGAVYWMPGVGDGTFGPAQLIQEGTGANGRFGQGIEVADVDGDGSLDILAAYGSYDDAVPNASDEGAIWIGYGDGVGGFPASDLLVGLPGAGGSRQILVEDVDLNGQQDVIRGSFSFTNGEYYEGATLIHLATGVRSFDSAPKAIETNLSQSNPDGGLVSGDFDQDSLPELVVGIFGSDVLTQDGGEVYIYSACEGLPF